MTARKHAVFCDIPNHDAELPEAADVACASAPVLLWPGTTAWLVAGTYPEDKPTVVTDGPGGLNRFRLSEFRAMAVSAMELSVLGAIGQHPVPDGDGGCTRCGNKVTGLSVLCEQCKADSAATQATR